MSHDTSTISVELNFPGLIVAFGQRIVRMFGTQTDGVPFAKDFEILQRQRVSHSDHKIAAGYVERGREYYNKKKFKKARHYFDKAIHFDSDYALAHYYLGLTLYKMGHRNSAIAAWDHAVVSDPDSSIAIKAKSKLKGIRPDRVILPDEDEW